MSCKLLLCRSGRRRRVSCIQWDTTCKGSASRSRGSPRHMSCKTYPGQSGRRRLVSCTQEDTPRTYSTHPPCGSPRRSTSTASRCRDDCRLWVFHIQWDTPCSHPTHPRGGPRRSTSTASRCHFYHRRGIIVFNGTRHTVPRPVRAVGLVAEQTLRRVAVWIVAGGLGVSSRTRHAVARPIRVVERAHISHCVALPFGSSRESLQ